MPAEKPAESFDLDDFVAARCRCGDHLNEQIPFSLPAMSDRLIAQHLVDQLDDAGYLRADLNETTERLGSTIGDVERVLGVLQLLESSRRLCPFSQRMPGNPASGEGSFSIRPWNG